MKRSVSDEDGLEGSRLKRIRQDGTHSASLEQSPAPSIPRVDRRSLVFTPTSTVPSTAASTCRLEEDATLDENLYDTCFGMVKVEGHSLRTAVLIDSGDAVVDAALSVEHGHFVLRNSASREYAGRLDRNHRTAIVLQDLQEHCDATIQAVLLREKPKSEKKYLHNLYFVLNAMRRHADYVGQALDKAGLFLQNPQNLDPSTLYFNPHHLFNPRQSIGQAIPPSSPTKKRVTQSPGATVLDDTGHLKLEIRAILNSAHGPDIYSQSSIVISPDIRTDLKPHQLKALAMMAEKDRGNLEGNEFGSLWSILEEVNRPTRYKNTVTGSVQCNVPRLCHGGLLADDMGLGKTLTTIAFIASSKPAQQGFEGGPQTTLVIMPLSLLQTWEEQIVQHAEPGKISYYKYHGATRCDVAALLNYDIVLTTYDTVVADNKSDSKGNHGDLRLQSLEWHRIILDEAHIIRNRSTRKYRDIHSLKARYRWCLTGTPIFNRLEDLGSLLGFLRAGPFDITSTFNSRIAVPVAKQRPDGLQALQRLVQAISLRRTKESIRDNLQMPDRKVVDCRIQLSDSERKSYTVLEQSYSAFLQQNDPPFRSRNSMGGVMQTIQRLRQFCNHGLDLLPRTVLQLFDSERVHKLLPTDLLDSTEKCAICLRVFDPESTGSDPFGALECGHCVCIDCQKRVSKNDPGDEPRCCLCAASDPSESPEVDRSAPSSKYTPSSKVRALLENLRSEHESRSDAEQPHPLKSVVFSSWKKMLDLIQLALIDDGFRFERIDGSMNDERRRAAMNRFREDKDCSILLATIGSAGVGLDLTVASRVHLVEPQWTPTTESQAIDRVHRLGQKRDVIAMRYIVENSIEEYVVATQERKSDLIRQSFQEQGVENTMSAKERLIQYLKH